MVKSKYTKNKVRYVRGEREKNVLEFIIKMASECLLFSFARERERVGEQGDQIQEFMTEKDKN